MKLRNNNESKGNMSKTTEPHNNMSIVTVPPKIDIALGRQITVTPMPVYKTQGFRPVKAGSLNDAADIIAARLARQHYGRKATVRTCKKTAWAADGAWADYAAFVGLQTGLHETTGKMVYFNVRSAS